MGKGNRDARNSLYASRSRGACPAVVSSARCPLNVTMCAGRSARDDSFFYRRRRTRPTSAPVTVPWRAVIALIIARGVRLRVLVTGSAISRRFDSLMLSRIATAKAAEHATQAALESVARLKTSRAAGPALACRSAGIGKSGLSRNASPGLCVLRTAQTASSHTPNRNPKASHSANTPRTARLIAIFHAPN
jgi:hypothetical protein